ncbi:MAG: N-acetylmuramoyl-L-alanine amidase [Oscillospiraceae bacterium]|jgi:N-acetylmuramoyl-L-alanine amidase|nr:N-acetylmuramoyl-L-alanine amidase [Oscillospiraceae bacterium]
MKAHKIWIDAGHGNKDPGAVGLNNRREADDNLRLAMLVEPLLRARGFGTGMTRTANNFTTSRVTAAMNANADIYLSLHRNDNKGESGHGYETITKENFSSADNALAQAVHRRMVEAGIQRDRGIKRINLSTLTSLPARIAGCTLEVGFMRNQRDNELFDQNLQRYARAIVQGVCDVYGAPIPEFTTIDAKLIMRHVAKIEPLNIEQIKRYDFDGNGVLTANHALRILRIIAGLDPKGSAGPVIFKGGDEVLIAAA